MRAIALSTMVVGLLAANLAVAGDHCTPGACCSPAKDCCRDCGRQKICKIVCGVKKVKKTVWVVECEEFCAPLPGCRSNCCWSETSCCDAETCGSCAKDSCRSVRGRCIVPPKCGPVRCRKKLVKKEIVSEEPIYTCVVVPCGGCEPGVEATAPAERAAESPPLPPIARSAPELTR